MVEDFEVQKYWISGRRRSKHSSTAYSWKPSSNLHVTGCGLKRDKKCLYFNRQDECYNSNEDCSNQNPFICEY